MHEIKRKVIHSLVQLVGPYFLITMVRSAILDDEGDYETNDMLDVVEHFKEPLAFGAIKKDSCKTFADLISATRYGEREINSTQPSGR